MSPELCSHKPTFVVGETNMQVAAFEPTVVVLEKCEYKRGLREGKRHQSRLSRRSCSCPRKKLLRQEWGAWWLAYRAKRQRTQCPGKGRDVHTGQGFLGPEGKWQTRFLACRKWAGGQWFWKLTCHCSPWLSSCYNGEGSSTPHCQVYCPRSGWNKLRTLGKVTYSEKLLFPLMVLLFSNQFWGRTWGLPELGEQILTEPGPRPSIQVLHEKADIWRRDINSCKGGRSWSSTIKDSCELGPWTEGGGGRHGSTRAKTWGQSRQRWYRMPFFCPKEAN